MITLTNRTMSNRSESSENRSLLERFRKYMFENSIITPVSFLAVCGNPSATFEILKNAATHTRVEAGNDRKYILTPEKVLGI